MRGCSANWINGAAIDEKVEVGSIWAVRVVARRADLLAQVPPAVLAADHVLVAAVVQPCASADTARRGRYPHPVAGDDAAGGGEVRMEFNLRVRRATAEACDVAVLRFAEMRVLGRGENKREARREVATRARRDSRLGEFGGGRGGRGQRPPPTKMPSAPRGRRAPAPDA